MFRKRLKYERIYISVSEVILFSIPETCEKDRVLNKARRGGELANSTLTLNKCGGNQEKRGN